MSALSNIWREPIRTAGIRLQRCINHNGGLLLQTRNISGTSPLKQQIPEPPRGDLEGRTADASKNPFYLMIGVVVGVMTLGAFWNRYKYPEGLEPKHAKAAEGKEHQSMYDSAKQKLLETGSSIMQSFAPINNIHAHIQGYHFYSDDINRQVEAHHFCSHLSEDMMQCVIYDSDKPHARLLGVEYIISERLFKQLPPEEQMLWHSHVYEVKGGLLTTPRLPRAAEKEIMHELVNTFGKTFHMWQIDKGDQVPMGPPQLMLAFTKDGQWLPELEERRNRVRGVTTKELIDSRKDIVAPKVTSCKQIPSHLHKIHPNADPWDKGICIKTSMQKK